LMRAWVAIVVLLFHFLPHYRAMGGRNPLMLQAMPWGYAGVDIFFIVSGFVMMHLLHGRAATPGTARVFLTRRFLRIYAWYLPCMLVRLATLVMFDRQTLVNVDLFQSITLTSLEMSRLVLPISWSLSYELYFYCVLALLWGVLGRRLIAGVWVAFGVLLVRAVLLPQEAPTFLHFAVSPFLIECFAGALLYHYTAWIARKQLLPVFAAVVATGIWMGVSHNATNDAIRSATWGVAAFFLVCFFVTLERQGLYAGGRIGRALGDASYSIYLLHLPFISLFNASGLGSALEAARGWRAEAGFVFTIGLFLYGCVLIHRYLERPLYEKLARRAGAA
jgi:exopolysaccharide production protein ExoZ